MTVTLEVYEADHSTLVDTIDPGQWLKVKVADVANLGGGGELEVPNLVAEGASNPALLLLTPGRVVRVVSDGVDVGSFALEQPSSVLVSPREESGEVTVVTGREPMAARFDKVRWFPDRGLGNLPFHPDRPLSFAADRLRDDDPDGPQGAWPLGVGQLPNYDTDNYFGRPIGFIDTGGPGETGPHWVADRDSRTAFAPGGVTYFRQRVELDSEYDVLVQAAWDDEGELWIDDVPVLKSEGVYLGGCSEARVRLTDGEHLVAGFVRNLNELRTGIVFAGWSVSDGMADNLLFRSNAASCLVLGFPDEPPGFTPTEVIRLGWDEAQDRGMLTDVTMDFLSAVDTDSQPMHEVVDITVKAPADSLLTTCQMLAATYLDLAATKDDLELQAWIRGTRGEDRTATVTFTKGTCAEIRWGSDFAEAATVAIVATEQGPPFDVEHPDAADLGRHEIALDFGNCSVITAAVWARRYLDEVSYARRSIAVTLVPGVGPVPHVDFAVGDLVLIGEDPLPFTWGGVEIVWGEDDTTDWGEVHRVHSIGLEVDAESVERWTVELDQPALLYEERLANILKRQTPGAAGGRTVLPTPSTPSFPSVRAGSEDVHTWQFDGDAGDVQLLIGGTPVTGAVVTSPGAGGTEKVTVTDDTERQYVKGVDKITLEVGSSEPSPLWVPPKGRWVQEVRVTRDSDVDTTTITVSVAVVPTYVAAPVPPFPAEGDDYYLTLVGGAVQHDSAALLDDGRMIYQYTAGGELWQSYYPTWRAFGKADNDSATTPYEISTHMGGTDTPFSTVFRMADGGLYMSAAYGQDGDSRFEMWSSPSGEGESAPGTPDWVLRSVIEVADGYPGFGGEFSQVCIGRPILFAGLWVLPCPFAWFSPTLEERIYLASIWTSEDGADGPWELQHTATNYPAGGTGASGESRQIVLHDGDLYWGSTGNSDPAHCAYSPDGTAWTEFDVAGNSANADPLFSVDGVMYRFYQAGFPGSWPDTDFETYIMATTGDPTATADPSSLILLFDAVGGALRVHQQLAVEGPSGQWAIIYRGYILVTVGVPWTVGRVAWGVRRPWH